MFRKALLVFLAALSARLGAPGELTLEEGEALLRQFAPQHYRQMTPENARDCIDVAFEDFLRALHNIKYPNGDPPPSLLYEPDHRVWGHGGAAFLELHGPWEPAKRYVLLYYFHDWVLVASKDQGKTWEEVQDSGGFLSYCHSPICDLTGAYLAQVDVDLDDTPEVVIGYGERDPRAGGEDLFIYAFRDGRLELISPGTQDEETRDSIKKCHGRNFWVTTELSSPFNRAFLDDVDRDNVAEVVVMPGLRDWDETIDGSWEEYSGSPGPRCRACVEMDQPIRVYKLKNGRYQLWKEIDRREDFPFGYPALGGFHPGVVTYSQLKNGQGLGELRVFVSTPAIGWVERGPRMTVDDYDVGSFVVDFNGKPLKFRKKWENKRFPELGKGDQVVNGVWVYELLRKGCPPWEVNPAEVAYPHPDPCREYAFVGPYMEFSVRREDVADFILRSAEKRYSEQETRKAQGAPLQGPEREVVFVQVDILGSLKNGKRVLVQALIGVKKDTSPQAPKAAGAK